MNVVEATLFSGTIAAVIGRQLLQRGPPLWAILAVGSIASLAAFALPPAAALTALANNAPVFLFLFSLFVFAAALERAGALDHLAAWIVGRARNLRELPLVLFAATGALAAFILNDALVLVGVPVLLALARRLRVAPQPLLLTLAFSVTVGSVLTPFGNPQNLLVSLDSGVPTPVFTFLRFLLVPTIVNLLLGGLYLQRVFDAPLAAEATDGHRAIPAPRIPFFPRTDWPRLVRRFPVLVLFPATMIAVLTVDLVGAVTEAPPAPLDLMVLVGAVLTLALSGGRAQMLRRVDWSILVLFAGLFIVVAAASQGGVLSAIEANVPLPGPSDPRASVAGIVGVSLGGAQLVSNVPWVALQIPWLHSLGYGSSTPIAWVALAAGSTLAGNLTFLGAASNLIVVGESERAGVRIRLRDFVRVGAPLTAMTVLVLVGCLWIGL